MLRSRRRKKIVPNPLFRLLMTARGLFDFDAITDIADELIKFEFDKQSGLVHILQTTGLHFFFPIFHGVIMLIASFILFFRHVLNDITMMRDSPDTVSDLPFYKRYANSFKAAVKLLLSICIFILSILALTVIINPAASAGMIIAFSIGSALYELTMEVFARLSRNATIKELRKKNEALEDEREEFENNFMGTRSLKRQIEQNKLLISYHQQTNRAQIFYMLSTVATIVACILGFAIFLFPPFSITAVALVITASVLITIIGFTRTALSYLEKKNKARLEVEMAKTEPPPPNYAFNLLFTSKQLALREKQDEIRLDLNFLNYLLLSHKLGDKEKVDQLSNNIDLIFQVLDQEFEKLKNGQPSFKDKHSIEAFDAKLNELHNELDNVLNPFLQSNPELLQDTQCQHFKKSLMREGVFSSNTLKSVSKNQDIEATKQGDNEDNEDRGKNFHP